MLDYKTLPKELLYLIEAANGRGVSTEPNDLLPLFSVTFFPNQSAQDKDEKSLTLYELCDKIQDTTATAKNLLPWLKLGRFGDRRTDKNCLRHDKNTEALSGVELDYDDKKVSFEDAVAIVTQAGLMALLYTSANYKPEAPKWRILLPTSELLFSDEDAVDRTVSLRGLRTKLAARINGLFGGIFSGESFTLSQSYYYGGISGNPSHSAVVVEGDYIDLRDDLDAGAIGKPKAKAKSADGKAAADSGEVHGFKNYIALLGDGEGRGGFNNMLLSATASYAAEHGSNFDRALLKMFLVAAVERAPKGAERPAADIQRYTSDEYLDNLIDTAVEKYGEDERAKADAAINPCSLDQAHNVFKKWLGSKYDIDALDATLAAAASERLTGDPLWLLLVSGPGAAKTETVQALDGAGAHITSTIASEGALLSASRTTKHNARTATGGLLRKIGASGVLVIKDVTSIISAARETRGMVLAAIREIYDGRWQRNVGTDGGQTLTWIGRIVVVGAVTTLWDSSHAVIAACGDRFVLLRIDSNEGRLESGRQSILNTGSEETMRKELADAVGGVIKNMCIDNIALLDDESGRLLKVADLVTMARTAVERDYQGNVIDSHAPEMPTRFAKQLGQMVRGAVAIGMKREDAMRLALRCARDSMPSLRLNILADVAYHPNARPNEVRKRIGKPWMTVRREMEALHMLGLLDCTEEKAADDDDDAKDKKTVWHYRLKRPEDDGTLKAMVPSRGDGM